jgi:hypothetical protein
MNLQALIGLVVMVGSQAATFAGIELVAQWNTPIAWTGFILFADGIVWRARGRSWLRSSPGEFALLALLSIPLWLVFEFFNLFLVNWHYVGLPENRTLRLFGYAWAFATIWPAIFEAADLIDVRRGPRSFGEVRTILGVDRPIGAAIISIAAGAIMLALPLVFPSSYLAAPVFLGFIFLLDPINQRLGGESLAADIHIGDYRRLTNLLLSGFLCGFLWEFWNFWATAKWHYTVPIMENLKIFEMPVPGYFGFPAFALECFTMYVFVRTLWRRWFPAVPDPDPARLTGRPIGVAA